MDARGSRAAVRLRREADRSAGVAQPNKRRYEADKRQSRDPRRCARRLSAAAPSAGLLKTPTWLPMRIVYAHVLYSVAPWLGNHIHALRLSKVALYSSNPFLLCRRDPLL
jgi:hypothetical protein